MKHVATAVAFLILFSTCQILAEASESPRVTSAEAAERVAKGEAVLIDVREPEEWEEGVAAPAHLLPLSDLRGDRAKWNEVLRELEGKEVLLYCRTGNRSGIAAGILAKEGIRVANAGSFREWQAAGLPERKPQDERKSKTLPGSAK